MEAKIARIVQLDEIIEPTANAVNITGNGDWIFIGPNAVLIWGGGAGADQPISTILKKRS